MITEINNIHEILSEYQIIDTRRSDYFLGYRKNKIRGHIKGSISFPVEWIPYIDDSKKVLFANQKGIDFNKPFIFFDEDKSRINSFVNYYHKQLEEVLKYEIQCPEEYFNENPEEFTYFSGYKFIVSPEWVFELISGAQPDTYNSKKYKIFDANSIVSDGELDGVTQKYVQQYIDSHIPGAEMLDINMMEDDDLLNIVPFNTLKSYIESKGIEIDTTVIVYSTNKSAAFRAAFILYWAGVEDVRVLDGGFEKWKDLGLPTESGENTTNLKVTFTRSCPLNGNKLIVTGKEIRALQCNSNLKLVSVRSWEEYIGKVNGYEFLDSLAEKIVVGEPKDAIWGFAGKRIKNMDDYYAPDGRLRNPYEIESIWRNQGLGSEDIIAFYCGTGWRACVPLFFSFIMGWKQTHLYDGSWIEWSRDKTLPIELNSLVDKPSSLNDYK